MYLLNENFLYRNRPMDIYDGSISTMDLYIQLMNLTGFEIIMKIFD